MKRDVRTIFDIYVLWTLIVVTIRTERVIMTFFTGMVFNDIFNNISIFSGGEYGSHDTFHESPDM
jgi:hypothetical protein